MDAFGLRNGLPKYHFHTDLTHAPKFPFLGPKNGLKHHISVTTGKNSIKDNVNGIAIAYINKLLNVLLLLFQKIIK